MPDFHRGNNFMNSTLIIYLENLLWLDLSRVSSESLEYIFLEGKIEYAKWYTNLVIKLYFATSLEKRNQIVAGWNNAESSGK